MAPDCGVKTRFSGEDGVTRREDTGEAGGHPQPPHIPVAAVQTAMLGGLPYTVFCDAIVTHPTMAEGLNALFAAVPPARS